MTKITENSVQYIFQDEETKLSVRMFFNSDLTFSILPQVGDSFRFPRESKKYDEWVVIARLIGEATQFAIDKIKKEKVLRDL